MPGTASHFLLKHSSGHRREPRRPACRARGRPRTLYDKIFEDHTVDVSEDGTALVFVDRHLVHEVTSPQAFEGLRTAGRPVRRPDCTLATVDHNVPTSDRASFDSVATFIKDNIYWPALRRKRGRYEPYPAAFVTAQNTQ